jgi:hypothetical protein
MPDRDPTDSVSAKKVKKSFSCLCTFNIAEESAKLRSGAEGAQPIVLPVIEPKKMGGRRRDKNSLDINICRLPMPELILRDFQLLDYLMHKLASRLKDYRGVNDAGGIEALCIFYGGESLFVCALFKGRWLTKNEGSQDEHSNSASVLHCGDRVLF